MSYDLAVWEGDRPSNDFAAQAELERLFEQYMDVEHIELTPRIAAYVNELLQRYPDLDPQADEDDPSPWSVAPLIRGASGPLMYFPMVYSRAEEVSAFAAQLAEDHGLNCYDPQWNQLRTPARDAWRFQLKSQRGRSQRDPDADAIRKFVTHLSSGNFYASLTRADGWYVQAGYGEQAGTRPGWYALERQDGSLDHHFRTELADVHEVVAAFVAFSEGDPTLLTRFTWQPYSL